MLKETLTTIYSTDVKTASNRMIREHAVKIGITTALSQSDKLDTVFVLLYELDLIKQLVMLYGYRPSDAKLLKIYRTVLTNALIAYGIQSTTANIATGVTKKIGDIAGSIPVLGAAIGTVIDCTSQGVINSSLTVVIGIQTKKYLKEEYHLQDMLDNVEFEDETSEEDEKELINSVRTEVSGNKKKPEPALAK